MRPARTVVLDSPRLRRGCLVAGLGGTLVAALAGIAAPVSFFAAWLFAWLAVLALSLGALANVMIHELTGGEWGFVVRRPLEAALATLPVVAMLGVPLLFGLADLYPWAAPHAPGARLDAKAWWLDMPFFVARAIVYFAIWIAIATAMRRQWQRHRTNATRLGQPAVRRLAIVGLAAYAVTMTLASVDWIMARSADWYSTGFGLLVLTSQAYAAFAFAAAASAASGAMRGARAVSDDRSDALVERANPARDAQDLGNIVLTYAMLWAYLAFMQFLIIWAEDLPAEIGWYVTRSTPPWKAAAIAVLVLQFALPFAAMLFRDVKRDPRRLGMLCVAVLAGHWLQVAWQVLPSSYGSAPWIAVAAAIGVGGWWLAAFSHAYARVAPGLPDGVRMAVDHG
jgi:hypothetical protein